MIRVLPGFGPDGSASARVAVRAARAWLSGGIVGLPTETVYGLAADAQHARAVGRVYAVKGRPPDHPLIVHVSAPAALDGWSAARNEAAHRLAEVFWPGPLTLIVARGERAGDFITGGQPTVALRCPDHPVALACLRALAEESGDPARGVAAPSANRFGRVSPTRAGDVVAELGARLDPSRDLVVDGGACSVGVESTIVDCTADPPRVLRLGAISQAQVDRALVAGFPTDASGPGVVAGQRPDAARPGGAGGASAPAPRERGGRGPAVIPAGPAQVRAPGSLASHYAPHARVILMELEGVLGVDRGAVAGVSGGDAGRVGLLAPSAVGTPPGWTRLAAPASDEQYARVLYGALRRADELGLAVVLAVLPPTSGSPLAHAVRDRLTRAAHGE